MDEDERAEVAVVEVEPLVGLIRARLADRVRPGLIVQFVGPSGCGKSTHLAALRRHFPRAPSIGRFDGEQPPDEFPGDLLFVDDAHLLPGTVFYNALDRSVAVLATHKEFGPHVGSWFRHERVTRRLADEMTVERLEEIVRRRLVWARRAEGPVPTFDRWFLGRLLDRHGSDVGAILGDLYEAVEDLRARDGPGGAASPSEP